MASTINGTSTGNGGLVSTGDDSGVLNIQTNETTAISIDASQSVDFTNNIDAPNTFGFKNRIINGAMQINQRAFNGTPSTGNYLLDRYFYNANANRVTVSQSSDAPAGFTNSILVTSSAASSIGTGDYTNLCQVIEGYNISDLSWGSASAKSITISFWVKSSLTGTFGGGIRNKGTGGYYGYPFTYTISAANTWTYVTVTVAGPTSYTWDTDNTQGVYVWWDFGSGTTYTNTSGTWVNQNIVGANGTTKLVNTSGATWQMTGAQFEKGTQATSFDFRSYGTELLLCQRYFELLDYSDVTNNAIGNSTRWATSNDQWCNVSFKVLKRTTPSATSVGTVILYGAGSTATATPSYQYISPIGLCMRVQPATYTVDYGFVGNYSGFKLSVSAEL